MEKSPSVTWLALKDWTEVASDACEDETSPVCRLLQLFKDIMKSLRNPPGQYFPGKANN